VLVVGIDDPLGVDNELVLVGAGFQAMATEKEPSFCFRISMGSQLLNCPTRTTFLAAASGLRENLTVPFLVPFPYII